jgi:hypothetical protein
MQVGSYCAIQFHSRSKFPSKVGSKQVATTMSRLISVGLRAENHSWIFSFRPRQVALSLSLVVTRTHYSVRIIEAALESYLVARPRFCRTFFPLGIMRGVSPGLRQKRVAQKRKEKEKNKQKTKLASASRGHSQPESALNPGATTVCTVKPVMALYSRAGGSEYGVCWRGCDGGEGEERAASLPCGRPPMPIIKDSA